LGDVQDCTVVLDQTLYGGAGQRRGDECESVTDDCVETAAVAE
jgi:hypothetical protein